MTRLRRRMTEDLQLRGVSANTQRAYLGAVKHLAQHYHKSPDQLSEEELRAYLLYLKREKKVSKSTFTVYLCGIKFFYEHTLKLRRPRSPYESLKNGPVLWVHHKRLVGNKVAGEG